MVKSDFGKTDVSRSEVKLKMDRIWPLGITKISAFRMMSPLTIKIKRFENDKWLK